MILFPNLKLLNLLVYIFLKNNIFNGGKTEINCKHSLHTASEKIKGRIYLFKE